MMNKKAVAISLGTLALVVGAIYFGISADGNSAMQKMGLQEVEGGLAAVVHLPTTRQLQVARDSLEVREFVAETVDEDLMIIPYEQGSTISIYEVRYQGDRWVQGEQMVSYEACEALYAKVPVPCGMPVMKVVVNSKEQVGEYVISYDGKGDREQVQAIMPIIER